MGLRHVATPVILLTAAMVLNCSDSTSPNDDNGTPANVAGAWQGNWHSAGTFEGGPFMLQAEQTGSTIGGAITIPDIDMNEAPVTGQVAGRTITFGDINHEIEFTGTVDVGDTTASGTYQYPAMGDNGTWFATKGGIIVAMVDSFALPQGAPKDIAWDGTRVCVLMGDQIWSLDPSTGESTSHATPGLYPQGIAFDGEHLLVGDSPWGTRKIYRLTPGSTTMFRTPGTGQITGLAFDGSYLWCTDGGHGAGWLYRVTTAGDVVDSARCEGTIVGGLAFDGTALWYASWDAGQTRIYQCDTFGRTLTSFPAPGSPAGQGAGLAFGNGHLWYADAARDSIHEVDTAGHLLSSFPAPGLSSADLAFDGTYLWVADGDVGPTPDRLYQLDSSGSVISQVECPGSSPGGLAYDGQDLWLADKVTRRAYRIPRSGDYVVSYPDFDIGYLTSDGTDLWGTDMSNEMIHRFDATGSTVSSIPYPWEDYVDMGGISHDGTTLWVAKRSWLALDSLLGLDASGAIVTTYRPLVKVPEPCGITVAGSDVWMIGRLPFTMDHKLYRLRIQSAGRLTQSWSPPTS